MLAKIKSIGLMLVVLLSGISTAQAHESRPLYIELTERDSGVFALQWRTPPSVERANTPMLGLDKCETATPVSQATTGAGVVRQQLYRCEQGVSGALLTIQYPHSNPSVSNMVKLKWNSGEVRSQIYSPDEREIVLTDQETAVGVAKQYTWLGVEHIWIGTDHLLFVACLVLIAGSWKRLLLTITGFTLAHSVTLALAALNMVRLPIAPVEAVIALSIVFLAMEIARGRSNSLTWRYPIAVSSSFGLLHGFGFASVLSEIGLPQTEVPTALLFFNVGVELGQIAFVAVVIGLLILMARLVTRNTSGGFSSEVALGGMQRPVAYVIGIVACSWMIERIVLFWV